MGNIISGVILFSILAIIVGFMLLLIYCGIYTLINKRATKWIDSKYPEIRDELKVHDFKFEKESFTYIKLYCVGYYISESHYNTYSKSNTAKRTKLLNAWQFRNVIFEMYKRPYNEVLNEMFLKYENHVSRLAEKENRQRFSDNKYKRAVKFKKPEEVE